VKLAQDHWYQLCRKFQFRVYSIWYILMAAIRINPETSGTLNSVLTVGAEQLGGAKKGAHSTLCILLKEGITSPVCKCARGCSPNAMETPHSSDSADLGALQGLLNRVIRIMQACV
jgi:hypothetical protein